MREPVSAMASKMMLLLFSLVLLSKGTALALGKKCTFENQYICGIQDCNCRYVSQNGVSLYRQFLAMFSQDNGEDKVCDKCDIFCSEEKHINCEHGTCDKQKGCICRDCWTGETCSKYHNSQPEFKETHYVAEINDDTSVGDEILQVSASDSDLEKCVDKNNCPCGRMKYSINKGNEDGLFNINPDNGVINLASEISGQYDPISLTILAKNEIDLNMVKDEQSGEAFATVVVTIRNNDTGHRERRSLHHRARRSVTKYESLEITFESVSNKTFFAAGCTVDYRLYLVQNSSASPSRLSSIQAQLSFDNLRLGDDYSVNISNTMVNPTKRHLSVGTVQLDIAQPLEQDDYLEIKFNATVPATLGPLALLQVAFTMNATASGPVTYGPKYSKEIYTNYPEITFARTTDGAVQAETTLDYNVNITLPYFNFTFEFEITTIVNKFRFLSIENVVIGDVSTSIKAQYPSPSPVMYVGVDDNITSRVVLNFGEIKVLATDQTINTIKLSFSTKVNDHHLLANASTHWVGLGATSGKEMLWVGQDAITLTKDEPYLYAEIQALNATNPTRYYANDVLHFSWTVKHAENGSYQDADNVKILFYFSSSLKRQDNGASSGLKVHGTEEESTTSDGRTLLTYTYTENSGRFAKGTVLSGKIEGKVKQSVSPLADLDIEIKIEYQTTASKKRPVKTYKASPGYLAGVPSFNLSSNAPDRLVNIGQLIDITTKIIVKKMTLEGKLYVILPVKNGSAIMRFVPHESFKVKSRGSNLADANQAFDNSKATFNSTNTASFYDRAEIELGRISNVDLTESALGSNDNNALTISFRVVLEDSNNTVNYSNYKISVGVKGSEHMIWISQMTFIANLPLIRRPSLLVEPFSNATDSLVQGSIVEYNFTVSHKETSNAHVVDVQVVWMIPPYVKYLNINQKSHEEMSYASGNNIIFKLGKLDFGETATASFSVALDPEETIKKCGKTYAVTPVALSYKSKAPNSMPYYEQLVPMSVAFKVPERRQNPPNAVPEFYQRGFLVDKSKSAIYICSVSSKRNKPSCFWTNSKGATWRAVDVMVINIIGIDSANGIVYGVGNNKISYMKYIPNRTKWYSISYDQWKQATLSDNQVVQINDSDADADEPVSEKQIDMGNGEKWGATKAGVFHSPQTSVWKRKASWKCCD